MTYPIPPNPLPSCPAPVVIGQVPDRAGRIGNTLDSFGLRSNGPDSQLNDAARPGEGRGPKLRPPPGMSSPAMRLASEPIAPLREYSMSAHGERLAHV